VYRGCKDLELPTPNNHIITKTTIQPMITISDLHPYTSYKVQVIAYNSRHFSMFTETTFRTKESGMYITSLKLLLMLQIKKKR